MDLFLIALSLETLISLDFWIMVAMAAFGLGMVIFVHELGHFAVAKWCGVKCEKFYLGFDIGGWKLWSFQWGETEYGIGVLPLGGYVKMLGQDDNPAHAAQEAERAKLQSVPGGAPAPEPVDDETPASFDPRSYMAQSVPKRMAIISAGVIMNVLFAFVAASMAWAMGVRYVPSVVSGVVPGAAAWEAGIQPGDEIVRINDTTKPRFDMDLMSSVVLANLDRGVELEVKRPGREETFIVNVKPRKKAGEQRPTIGVYMPHTTRLSSARPALPGSPAAQVTPKLKEGDVVVAVDGQPVEHYYEVLALLAEHRDEPLALTIRRPAGELDLYSIEEPSKTTGEEFHVELPANPLRMLGLQLEMGPITAIAQNSPAAGSDLQPGDVITAVNGEPVGDPMTLAERIARLGETPVTLRVARAGQDDPVEVTLTPRKTPWYDLAEAEGTPVSLPSLGIALQVKNIVAQVEPGSSAAKQGLKPGDQIVQFEYVPAEKETGEEEESAILADSVDLVDDGKDLGNVPLAYTLMQLSLPDTQVKLHLSDGSAVTIEPQASSEWFYPDRGLKFDMLRRERQAESLGEAVTLGLRQTKEFLFQVFGFIQKLISRQISAKMIGGPIMIAQAAGASFSAGLPQFLMVLAMISANLAVINFLPIPVLDGGHMVFLTLEGLRGKPVSERVVVAFHYAGLCFILALMLFVITLDVQRLGGG